MDADKSQLSDEVWVSTDDMNFAKATKLAAISLTAGAVTAVHHEASLNPNVKLTLSVVI